MRPSGIVVCDVNGFALIPGPCEDKLVGSPTRPFAVSKYNPSNLSERAPARPGFKLPDLSMRTTPPASCFRNRCPCVPPDRTARTNKQIKSFVFIDPLLVGVALRGHPWSPNEPHNAASCCLLNALSNQPRDDLVNLRCS